MSVPNKLVDYFNRLIVPFGEMDGLVELAKNRVLTLLLEQDATIDKEWVDQVEEIAREIQKCSGKARGVLWELGKAVRRLEENKVKRGTKKKIRKKK